MNAAFISGPKASSFAIDNPELHRSSANDGRKRKTMATKKTTSGDDDALTRQIGVRLTETDYARLEGLAGALSVSILARVALSAGLDAIERDPGILLGRRAKR